MSIGTAMVLIALGVFFYLKPSIFKIAAKWFVVVVIVGMTFIGGYYGYGRYQASKQSKFLTRAPECIKPFPNTVDHCAPWDRKWSKNDVLEPGSIVEDDGTITSAQQNRDVMARMDGVDISMFKPPAPAAYVPSWEKASVPAAPAVDTSVPRR
jgi:hypothetical protein